MPSPSLFQALLLSLLLAACGGGPARIDAPDDDPLPQASLAESGLSDTAWQGMLAQWEDEGMQIDAIAVLVNGRLVASRAKTHTEATVHDLRSATKSVTSLLVGIAIDRGWLPGLDVAVDAYLPQRPAHASRAASRPLTLRDLLSMRSGLDCDDWDAGSPGNEERMYTSADWLAFFQDIPARAPPGSRFAYCTAGLVVAGEVVARAAGRPLPALAQEVLFTPLGIRQVRWATAPGGVTDAGGHLQMSVLSLAKLGELTRAGGLWQGRRIVSEAWLAESMRSHGEMDPSGALAAHMGLAWWLEPVRSGVAASWQARGNGGQLLIVVPEARLVVAATGHAYNAPPKVQWAPFRLLQSWLLPPLLSRP